MALRWTSTVVIIILIRVMTTDYTKATVAHTRSNVTEDEMEKGQDANVVPHKSHHAFT